MGNISKVPAVVLSGQRAGEHSCRMTLLEANGHRKGARLMYLSGHVPLCGLSAVLGGALKAS